MVYYFKFYAQPAKGNRYHGKIGYGEASIFVSGDYFNEDLDAMELAACAYITAQTWDPETLVEIRETNPPGPDWGRELVELYQKALLFGISGYFVATPNEDIPGGPTLRLLPY